MLGKCFHRWLADNLTIWITRRTGCIFAGTIYQVSAVTAFYTIAFIGCMNVCIKRFYFSRIWLVYICRKICCSIKSLFSVKITEIFVIYYFMFTRLFLVCNAIYIICMCFIMHFHTIFNKCTHHVCCDFYVIIAYRLCSGTCLMFMFWNAIIMISISKVHKQYSYNG